MILFQLQAWHFFVFEVRKFRKKSFFSAFCPFFNCLFLRGAMTTFYKELKNTSVVPQDDQTDPKNHIVNLPS